MNIETYEMPVLSDLKSPPLNLQVVSVRVGRWTLELRVCDGRSYAAWINEYEEWIDVEIGQA